MEKQLKAVEKTIGIKFKNKKMLEQAFVHRSYLNEHPNFELDHNERLEFLGDAVLELVVTEYLYNNFPNPEGELTNWRASLVNSRMLAKIGNDIAFEDCLYLSKGEAKDTGKARQFILANAMEALIGAIYLDQGWEIAKQFVLRWIVSKLGDVLDLGLWMDPKSRFQESAQDIVGVTPTYKVVREDGPDHAKQFVVAVYLEKEKIAEGEGGSKQEAQVAAAEAALAKKKWKGPKTEIIEREPTDPIG